MKVAIVDYNAGNTQSVLFALERLGVTAILTADQEIIQASDKVIFPGVGEASSAMRQLEEKGLVSLIPQLEQPFLGICLGLQLMCEWSEEADAHCLGILPLKVKRFSQAKKVPHIGWNTLSCGDSPLFSGLSEESYAYFVHSYFVEPSQYSICRSDYEQPFSSAAAKGNFMGVQFHPEKSGEVGERILKNFLEM